MSCEMHKIEDEIKHGAVIPAVPIEAPRCNAIFESRQGPKAICRKLKGHRGYHAGDRLYSPQAPGPG